MNRGVPPTELNARTGEFTPPGMTFRARSNQLSELAAKVTSPLCQGYVGRSEAVETLEVAS